MSVVDIMYYSVLVPYVVAALIAHGIAISFGASAETFIYRRNTFVLCKNSSYYIGVGNHIYLYAFGIFWIIS